RRRRHLSHDRDREAPEAVTVLENAEAEQLRARPAAHPALPVAITVLGLMALGATFSGSAGIVMSAGLALAAIILLLWRGGEPPILLMPAAYQWSQVAIKPIQTIFTGQPLVALAEYDASIDHAAYFGLAAVTALAVGMQRGARAARRRLSMSDADAV